MTDTIVFITGGSRGIGRALASHAPHGSRVVDLSRSGADGIAHVTADLSTTDGWDAAAATFERELDGRTDVRAVLLHCAGTLTPIGFAGEVDHEDYATNVVLNAAAGPVLGDRFLRASAHLGDARTLVMISSGAASSPYPGWSGYCAGKAALDHWVRTVGGEQRERGGATVLAIAPGVVATEMQAEIREQSEDDFPPVERFRRLHADGELRDPDDVARDIWRVVDSRPESGAVLDLRDLEERGG